MAASSVDESGKFVSAYLGQLQTTYDLRAQYPIPDRQAAPVERPFFYMPLEHAEDLGLQRRCVGLFTRPNSRPMPNVSMALAVMRAVRLEPGGIRLMMGAMHWHGARR